MKGDVFLRANCPILNNGTNYKATYQRECVDNLTEIVEDAIRRFKPVPATIFSCAYIIISILAIFGNGLVIYVVMRKREMRTNRNVFITNLALSNFALAAILIPFLWIPAWVSRFPYGHFMCKFANAFPGSNVYCSTLTISIIAIDRYYAIQSITLQAPVGQQKTHKAFLIAIAIWIVAFGLSVPLLMYYDVDKSVVFENALVHPGNVTESYYLLICNIAKVRWVSIFVSLQQICFLYVVPLVVLSIFNAKLSRFVADQTRNIGILRAQPIAQPSQINSQMLLQPEPVNRHLSTTTRITQAQRRHNRTTYLMITMACSYAVLWLPFVTVSCLIDFGWIKTETDFVRFLDESAKLLSFTSICVNPFLYGYLNTNFQREFREIFAKFCFVTPVPANTNRRNTETTWAIMRHGIQNVNGVQNEFASGFDVSTM